MGRSGMTWQVVGACVLGSVRVAPTALETLRGQADSLMTLVETDVARRFPHAGRLRPHVGTHLEHRVGGREERERRSPRARPRRSGRGRRRRCRRWFGRGGPRLGRGRRRRCRWRLGRGGRRRLRRLGRCRVGRLRGRRGRRHLFPLLAPQIHHVDHELSPDPVLVVLVRGRRSFPGIPAADRILHAEIGRLVHTLWLGRRHGLGVVLWLWRRHRLGVVLWFG